MPQPHKIIVGNGQDRSLHFCFNIQTELFGICGPKNSYLLPLHPFPHRIHLVSGILAAELILCIQNFDVVFHTANMQ